MYHAILHLHCRGSNAETLLDISFVVCCGYGFDYYDMYLYLWLMAWSWRSSNTLCPIGEVAARRAGLVLRLVTACGR